MSTLATILLAAHIIKADPGLVVTDDDASLQQWALTTLSRARNSVAGAVAKSRAQRRVWTGTIDGYLLACLRALAEVHTQNACQSRQAASSWDGTEVGELMRKGGAVDADLAEVVDDPGFATVDDDAAVEMIAMGRDLSEPPSRSTGTEIVAALLAALAADVDAAGRANDTGTLGRLRRLPHAALSPRLAARPRGGRALIAAA